MAFHAFTEHLAVLAVVIAIFLRRLRGWLDHNFDRFRVREEHKGEAHRLKQVADILMNHSVIARELINHAESKQAKVNVVRKRGKR